jgi:DNA-nicking Smr family endonuclease
MSISEEDKKLFREAMRDLPEQKPRKQKEEEPAVDPQRVEYFDDRLDDALVSAEEKISYFNQTLPYKVRKQLQQGKFEIDTELDLHKMGVEDARQAIAEFLQICSEHGYRCVILVHGKGRGGSEPILKNKVKQWLPQSKYVLAFCSCQPKHGGTGAVYILLR